MKIKFIIFFLCILISCQEENQTIILSLDTSNDGTLIHESALYGLGPNLKLNTPAKTDLIVYLEVSGTADLNFDFTLQNPITILKGEISAYVNLEFLDDNLDEAEESLILTIASVNETSVVIDSTPIHYLIEDDEDQADLRISLLWGSGGNTGSDQIDMDLYLWRESPPGSNTFELVDKKTTRGPNGFEILQLSGLEKDGLYGISYVYYHGETDNLTFTVILEAIGESLLENSKLPIEFNPTYGIININKETAAFREQFFTKENFHFKNVTQVTIPQSGS